MHHEEQHHVDREAVIRHERFEKKEIHQAKQEIRHEIHHEEHHDAPRVGRKR